MVNTLQLPLWTSKGLFDTVNHEILLQKLELYKIEENFDMLRCEFGAWMPDYERRKNGLLNLALDKFHSLLTY